MFNCMPTAKSAGAPEESWLNNPLPGRYTFVTADAQSTTRTGLLWIILNPNLCVRGDLRAVDILREQEAEVTSVATPR